MAESRPAYADFEDYRYMQRIVVVVRWFVIVLWLVINHWRATVDDSLLFVDLIGVGVILLNGWLHWKLHRGRHVSRRVAVGMSIADVIAITAGMAITGRFENNFFVVYYPALVGLALVVSSARLSILLTAMTAAAYSSISILMHPGLDIDLKDERALATRIFVMFAIVIAANLVMRIERGRRAEAVAAERNIADENLQLEKKARDAELAAAEQRFRIRREIHDGLVQSLYALTLQLSSAATEAERTAPAPISDRLAKLVPLSRQTLLEARHYMHDLSPMLAGEGELHDVMENLCSEFESVTEIPVALTVSGTQIDVPIESEAQICRILQEALANVLKHSGARQVEVRLSYSDAGVTLCVQDDGRGFDIEGTKNGFGLESITTRAQELGGKAGIVSNPGEGTRVEVTVPVTGPSEG
jgi:signal transduction histidine kinase